MLGLAQKLTKLDIALKGQVLHWFLGSDVVGYPKTRNPG